MIFIKLKHFIIVICLSVFVFLFVSCGSDENIDNNRELSVYQRISADEAYEKMRTETSFIILDVRTPDEFSQMRIPGSILIPDSEITNRAESELPDKNALILVYCRTGRRSKNATNELISMGYTNVFDFGGIADWPYEIEKD